VEFSGGAVLGRLGAVVRDFELVSVQCPSCGADLPPSRPCGSYLCAYCGSRFEVAQVRSAKTVHGASVDIGQLAQGIEPAARGTLVVVLVIVGLMVVLVIGGITAAIFMVTREVTASLEAVTTPPQVESPPPRPPRKSPAKTKAKEPAAEPPPRPERAWVSSPFGGAPAFWAEKGSALVIARMRRRDPDTLVVDAYRVVDGERVWRFDPGATYSEGSTPVRYATAREVVLVSDHRAQVHVLDGGTGELLSKVTLGDHFDGFCPVEEGLFVRSKDQQTWRLEDKSLEPYTERVRGCGQTKVVMPDHLYERDGIGRRPEHKRIEGSDTDWTRAFEVRSGLLATNRSTLLFGQRYPGTKVARVGRLDGDGTGLAWVTDVPEGSLLEIGDELARAISDGKRVYVAHASGKRQWQLTAIDVEGGGRVWSIAIPIEGSVINLEAMAVLDETVVVCGRDEIDAYEAATGVHRWSLGDR
jgi:hypothetical protein